MSQVAPFPIFVRMGDPVKGTALRLVRKSFRDMSEGPDAFRYWRDGGHWDVNIAQIGDALLSSSRRGQLNNQPLWPITYEEYAEDNGQYACSLERTSVDWSRDAHDRDREAFENIIPY